MQNGIPGTHGIHNGCDKCDLTEEAEAPPPGIGCWDMKEWDTDELIGKVFLFYEAQESGVLRYGHRVKWRGDTYVNDAINGHSLAGGWFDGGGVQQFHV